uniref:phytanoyl-CoA dioxygenase family protein n=1 Tax=Tabrizicola sp. TaxID=2005166 RepID=UPI00286CED52
MATVVTDQMVADFQRDGVVLVKGLWADWVDMLRAGVARNMDNPSAAQMATLKPGEAGSFFDDYCNWTGIPEFSEVIQRSDVADVAAKLMQSDRVQMFHDHVLVKEPGTTKATPWHTDGPYYFVEGRQTVSFWSPLDPVREAALRTVAGSHLWPRDVLPTRWLSQTDFY